MALNVMLFMTEPSGAEKRDLMCLSPTTEDFNNLRSSTTNFGSGFPDPNGESESTSEKKLSFIAEGDIFESKNKLFVFIKFFWI